MLLLVTFASKLVNQRRRSASLNIRKNSKSATFSFENGYSSTFKYFSKIHCASNNWSIRTQKYQKKRKDVGYKLPYEFFQNYFVVHDLWPAKDSFSTYSCGANCRHLIFVYSLSKRSRMPHFYIEIFISYLCPLLTFNQSSDFRLRKKIQQQ